MNNPTERAERNSLPLRAVLNTNSTKRMNSIEKVTGLGAGSKEVPSSLPIAQVKLSKDRIIQDVCEVYDVQTDAGKEFLRIALENVVLMDRKQRDYGSRNISGYGMFGVVVRMSDKFERIKHLFSNKRRKATNESIRDSLRDISNYAIIALMLDSGKWPDK